MSEIVRLDINEEWAHSGIIKAGDFCFLNYWSLLHPELFQDNYLQRKLRLFQRE